MRFLGFVFVGLILSSLLVFLDYRFPGSFLDKFLYSGFLETFAAIVGLNIAAIIFLLGQLLQIEEKYARDFQRSRNEIKHNAYFLLLSFVISFVLLILRPDPITGFLWTESEALNNKIYYGFNIGIICLFILALYSVLEILKAVFKIKNNEE